MQREVYEYISPVLYSSDYGDVPDRVVRTAVSQYVRFVEYGARSSKLQSASVTVYLGRRATMQLSHRNAVQKWVLPSPAAVYQALVDVGC